MRRRDTRERRIWCTTCATYATTEHTRDGRKESYLCTVCGRRTEGYWRTVIDFVVTMKKPGRNNRSIDE